MDGLRRKCGQEVHDIPRTTPEIQGAGAQSVSAMWSPPWIHPPFQAVPYLLPRVGLGGADSRRCEVELVGSRVAVGRRQEHGRPAIDQTRRVVDEHDRSNC